MADNSVTPINDKVAGVAELRRMHHVAADECMEEAINMLSFMELCGQVECEGDFAMNGTAVQDMAQAIVEKLRKAQKHHREGL